MINKCDEWLSNLKVGDEVVIMQRTYADSLIIHHVTRITKTMIVCGNYRFRRLDGCSPGDGFYTSRIVKPTQGLRDKIETDQLQKVITRIVADSTITLSELRAMRDAFLNLHNKSVSAGSSIG